MNCYVASTQKLNTAFGLKYSVKYSDVYMHAFRPQHCKLHIRELLLTKKLVFLSLQQSFKLMNKPSILHRQIKPVHFEYTRPCLPRLNVSITKHNVNIQNTCVEMSSVECYNAFGGNFHSYFIQGHLK